MNHQAENDSPFKFTIPNVRENSNIFVQQYERSHSTFSAVLDEMHSKTPRRDEDADHEIEILA